MVPGPLDMSFAEPYLSLGQPVLILGPNLKFRQVWGEREVDISFSPPLLRQLLQGQLNAFLKK